MRSESDDRVEPSFAMLAPVPLDLLEDADAWKPGGEIAFGTRSENLVEIEHDRAGHRVAVYIYASHDPSAVGHRPRVTWAAEYVGLEQAIGGRHPDEEAYRSPIAREDGIDYWMLFWHVVGLRRLAPEDQVEIGRIHGRGKRTRFVPHFTPEGPLLIEPV